MKFLVVALVVGIVVWLLVHGRRRQRPARKRAAADGAAQPMVACAHCGVHLPRGEAFVDARGSFCSEAHRLAGPR